MENEQTLNLSPEEQAIVDQIEGKVPTDDGSDVDLPSNNLNNNENKENNRTYAGKYNSVEELKKGISNLGSDLPDYVLNGMNDEALEQYYLDLQANFSKGRKHTNEENKTNNAEPSEKPSEAISDQLWSDLETYYNQNGNITDDMYDQLNKVGIPDAVIDRYMDGIRAEQEVFTAKIYDIAGGQESYNEIKAWAEENIPASQIEAIGNMSRDGMLIAMEGIKAKYDLAHGGIANKGDGKLRGSTHTRRGEGYNNQAEYILDIGDPRYGKDPKYTHAVNVKFENSTNLQ